MATYLLLVQKATDGCWTIAKQTETFDEVAAEWLANVSNGKPCRMVAEVKVQISEASEAPAKRTKTKGTATRSTVLDGVPRLTDRIDDVDLELASNASLRDPNSPTFRFFTKLLDYNPDDYHYPSDIGKGVGAAAMHLVRGYPNLLDVTLDEHNHQMIRLTADGRTMAEELIKRAKALAERLSLVHTGSGV